MQVWHDSTVYVAIENTTNAQNTTEQLSVRISVGNFDTFQTLKLSVVTLKTNSKYSLVR